MNGVRGYQNETSTDRMYRRALVKYLEAYRYKLSTRIRGASSVEWPGV